MKISDNRSIEEFLIAYENGQRQFEHWDFEEDGSVYGLDLMGVEFKNCFMFLDFRKANLTNSSFISCNIKTADFRDANLKNVLFRNCLVESTLFKGTEAEGLRFEENYSHGYTTKPGDFERLFLNSDDH